ncbi:ATP-binding protein [Sphingomonas mucosissima]|uniref:histidine kinase n=1 Tax=Sphingomonas mucosissima TaxID=370959 RepID=A0A245ZPW5_9SPHN|nr:ATP-binding protein [Sphingomonas mucosissima]OWK31780.1 sensor histidine kinase YycG [Sphingomonas mucosissima]
MTLPEAVAAEPQTAVSTAELRVSVAWTLACGTRPTYFATSHVVDDLHLVWATANGQPNLEFLSYATSALEKLIGGGEAAQAGRNSSARLRTLIDSLPFPIIFVDASSTEVFVNEPASLLLDIPASAPEEKEVAKGLAKLMAETSPEVRNSQLNTQAGAAVVFELDSNGRRYCVESHWVSEPHLTGRLWLFRDVTDEHHAARMKNELVSTVSHELRTPLTSIVGALGLMQSGATGQLPAKAERLVGVARRNSERLIQIINDLLDIDKLTAGKLDFNFENSDLARIVALAAEQNEAYAEKFDVRIRVEIPEAPVLASVDEGRIFQTMANLLSNSAKFSPAGSEVIVRLEARADFARISVIDQGRGLSEEFKDRLFTRFSQDRQHTVSEQSGTGLGLAITKGIVDAHGGRIYLDRSVNIGATFHVELPLRR